MNPTDTPYVLHGFDVSYSTAKARVAMRYKQLFLEERRAVRRLRGEGDRGRESAHERQRPRDHRGQGYRVAIQSVACRI